MKWKNYSTIFGEKNYKFQDRRKLKTKQKISHDKNKYLLGFPVTLIWSVGVTRINKLNSNYGKPQKYNKKYL